VGGVEGFGEGDEVEDDGGDGGGDGDVAPAGAVIEGCGQDRECGDAVEENSDSEPEEGHEFISMAFDLAANFKYIVRCFVVAVGVSGVATLPPVKVCKVFEVKTLGLDFGPDCGLKIEARRWPGLVVYLRLVYQGCQPLTTVKRRGYFLKTVTRLGPASPSSMTGKVVISSRSAHFALPKWSDARLLVS
jgi:hypothetical protein